MLSSWASEAVGRNMQWLNRAVHSLLSELEGLERFLV